jgi:hypothetical protein
MKRFALALAAVAIGGFAVTSDADAQSRWRRGGTTVIEQPSSGIDANTLALLAATGALGAGGAGGGMALLPFLLQQPTTTVIDNGPRWRPRPRPVPTARSFSRH